MPASPTLAAEISDRRARAAHYLPAWTIGNLPAPPAGGWRLWVGLIGPGVVLAGTSIGSGEWLFGPAVTAQYGASLLWLALLEHPAPGLLQPGDDAVRRVQRRADHRGGLANMARARSGGSASMRSSISPPSGLTTPRTRPFRSRRSSWATCRRRPPTSGWSRSSGFAVFLLAFVPLIFGGTVYRMLEKIMTAKLVLVLGYLSMIAVALVSWPVIRDVATGFFRFGTVPLRAADHRARPPFLAPVRGG